MEIFRLFGSILVDSSEADKSIQKTGDNAKSLSSKLGSGLKTIGKATVGIATAVAGAAAAAGAAIYSLSTDTAAVGDNVDKMSQKIGISREAYQELDFICSQSGTSVDNLKAGLKTLTSVMDTTRAGTSTTATALEELGISVANADGSFRDNEEVMWEAFAALTALEDQTEKERLAVELFGKAGSELMPMLNGSADSIEAMREQAHELGLVMSDEAIDASVKFTDTIDQLQRSFSAVKNELGASLLPVIQRAAAKLLDYMPTIQTFIERVIPVVERLAQSIIDPMVEMLDELLPPFMDFLESIITPLSGLISAILPVIIKVLDKILPIITEIITELLPPLVDILDGLTPILDLVLELIDPILSLIKGIIKPLGDVLDAAAPLMDFVVDLVNNALAPFKDEIETTSEVLEVVLGPALELVAKLLENTVVPAFDAVVDFLNGDWSGGLKNAGEAFIGVFKSAFEIIDGIFGTNISGWYNQITDFFNGFGSYLYSMSHQGEIDEIELHNKYSDKVQQVRLAANNNIRAGMSADEALSRAKSDILGSNTEALYYWDNYGNYDVNEAYKTIHAGRENEVEWAKKQSSYYVPHLATGGLVYGDTLAVVGDNADAKSNPEVVAPLSELTAINAKALETAAEKIAALIGAQLQKQPISIEVVTRLSDDTELTRAIIKNINDCTRQDGVCVIKGI